MPKPLKNGWRKRAADAMTAAPAPIPVSEAERQAIAAQSAAAVLMAAAAGINSIKQYTNPATVPG